MKQMAEGSQVVEKIVFFGAFSPASLTFAHSCRAMGVETFQLVPGSEAGVRRETRSAALSGVAPFDPALALSPSGLAAISEYCSRVGAGALATLAESNALWLAAGRHHFEPAVRVLLPPAACLEHLASKARQLELARTCGLDVLPTLPLATPADISAIDPARYPLCLRPESAASVEHTFRVEIVHSPAEALAVLERAGLRQGTLLAQPYLCVPNLVVHASSNASLRLLSADAFLADRKFDGLALRLRRVPMPNGLAAKIEAFAARAGLVGVYHFDFLYVPETAACFYLEVNPRFGGTTDKVARFGLDETAHCLQAHGLRTPRPSAPRPAARSRVVNKRAVLKHLVSLFAQRSDTWDYPRESRLRAALRSLSDLLVAADSIFDPSDLRGTLAYHLQRGSH